MAKRSLKASEIGIKKAKQAFRRTGWTQEYLASAVGLETRQSIWKFFSGRPIERHLFIDVCFQLNLEWEDIVAPPEDDEEEIEVAPVSNPSEVDQAVQTARSKLKDLIQSQCGLLQVSLDTAYPLGVEQIYTNQKVLPTPNNQRWLEVANFPVAGARGDRLTAHNGDYLTIPEVLSHHHKLVVLGRPGSGKTTLLQHLALQAMQGSIYPDRVPVFIPLRTLALEAKTQENFSLEAQIQAQWSAIGLTSQQIAALLHSSQLFVLLDGLDEIPPQACNELSYQIQKFAEAHPPAVILLTCRLAAQDYQFRGFHYVELAEFDGSQIATVARKWFVAMNRGQDGEATGLAKADQFLQHLDRPENEAIQEMVTTPLLLHLACLVFYERTMFPSRRAKLYQAGLDIFLGRWDRVRGIQRDLGAGHLSLPETLNLLSQIAFTLFEQGKIYFEKSEILPIISQFLLSLPGAPTDPEALWLSSEEVLRAIALQSGLLIERARDIYSFSHLTFQEYLTARKLVARCLQEPVTPLKQLADHLTEQRWNEVILLTLSLLPKADPLLEYLRQKIDTLVWENPTLKQVLQWVNQKAEAAPTAYKLAAVRAFYLPLCYNQDISLALALDGAFAFDLAPALARDLAIARTYQQIQQLGDQPAYKQIFDLWFGLDFGCRFPQESQLNRALLQLKAEFPNLQADQGEWVSWWKTHRQGWQQQFREKVLEPYNLTLGWDWNPLQQQQVWEYYKANQFLVDCLHSECSIQASLRSHLETTLLSNLMGTSSPCVGSTQGASSSSIHHPWAFSSLDMDQN